MSNEAPRARVDWPQGDGEMACRIRAHDWAATPLGQSRDWPQSLRTAVDLIVAMPGPATVLWGPQAVQIYNDAYRAIAEGRHPGLLGRPVAQGWPEVYEEVIAPLLAITRAGGSERLSRFPVRLADRAGGTRERLFDTDWLPIRDEAGQVAGALQTLRDVEDHARAEAALRESEDKYRTLFEEMDEGFAMCELVRDDTGRPVDFRYLDLNSALTTHVGIAPEALRGRRATEAFPDRDPWYLETFARVVESRTSVTEEHYFAHVDRWLRFNVFSRGGERFAVLCSDVTERNRAETVLRESERRQAFLLSFTDAIRSEPNEQAVIERAVRMLAKELAADRAYATRHHPAQDLTHVVFQFHGADVAPLPATLRFSDFPEAGQQTFEKTLVFEDTANDQSLTDRDKASLAAMGVGAMISRPLRRDGSPIFALGVVSTLPRRWTPGEVALVEEATERTWEAVERAGAEDALRESEERLASDLANAELLRGLAERLVPEENLQSIYDEVLAATVAITRADAGIVQLYDPAAKSLELIASLNFSRTITDYFHRVDAGSRTPCGIALNTGQRAFADFAEEVEDFGGQLLTGEGIQSAVAVPLMSRTGAPLGMLNAHWREARHRLNDSELRFLDLLARQAADLIEQRRSQIALREREEQFRRSVLDAPIPVIMHAEDGEVLQISRSWTELTGYTIEDHDVIQDWLTRAYGFGGEDLRDAMRGAFAPAGGDRPMRGVVFEITTRQGELRQWSFSASSPGTLSDGRRFIIGMAEDITDRARAEAALAESETLFRTLAEVIEDVFYVTDVDKGRLDYLSPAYEAVWGRPTDELTADLSRFIETIHPEDRPAVEANQSRQAGGEPVHMEYRILRPDGEVRWILDRCFPIPNGGRILSAGVASDITERRLAEERRRAGEERYRLLLQSVVDYAIFTIDRDGIVTSWPAGAEAVYGWSAEEIAGRSVDLTFVPEDIANGAPRIERETALREGLAPNVRWHRRRDGGRIFIDGSTQPLVGADGTVREFIKIGQDVTEAKRLQQSVLESEERLRNAVEVGRLGLWDWNIVSGEVHWSGEHYRMEGYAVGEVTPSFAAWADRLHPEDRADAVAALKRAMDEREEYAREFRVVHPDGTIRWLAARGRFFYDEGGKPVRMIGAMIDTTDRRNWEDRQKVLVAELQHRTRNLIGVVRSISERTASNSTDLDDFAHRFLDRIAALARVQGLLSQLDRSEQVTFDDLLNIELASMGATEGEVRLEGPAGVRLRSSAVQTLALGLHELATNAVKYGALGQAGASLFITWSVEAPQNGEKPILHIDWRETGVLMPGKVEPGARRGQGRELIEEALPYQLGAKTSYVLGADGVRCTIAMPIEPQR